MNCLALFQTLLNTTFKTTMTSLQSAVMMNTHLNAFVKNNDVTITSVEKLIECEGTCMIKNKQGKNCPLQDTYLIKSIGKCVCNYHINNNRNRILNLVQFHKKFNKYMSKVFKCYNDNNVFIENLKDILLLMINNRKHKYTLVEFYNTVSQYIDNFDINDDEYNALLDYYKSL